MKLKKGFMKYIWRLQQSQMIVAPIFWSLTLSGIFYEYVSPVFVRMGIIESSQVAVGLFILIICIFFLVLFIGYVYDKVLKMWAEQKIVAIERNIYAHTRQNAKEIVHWQYYLIPLMKSLGLDEEAAFLNRWNEHCMEEDKVLREDVYKIARWIHEYKMKPASKRWLLPVQEEIRKSYKSNNE